MKKLFLILFLYILFITHYSVAQWNQLNTGTTFNLNKIQFLNSQTGWAGGYQAISTQYVLIETTNAGLNWVNQISNFPFGNRVISLFFINANTGWIAGAEGIFKTTNGGENYFTITNPSPIVYDCYFINYSTGWTVGLESIAKVCKTTNGGNNWISQSINIGSSEQLFYVHFENEMTGWCTGTNTIIKTTNGGINWISQPHPTVSLINRIFAISPEIAWVTASGTVLSTTNGGTNWISRDINANYAISAFFLNSNTGYVSTSPRNVFKTTNNGLNWIAQMTDTASALYSIFFTSADTGFVCGSYGKIYKTINGGGVIGVKRIEENIPEKYNLFQNYPNPFNPTTNIRYQLTNNSLVNLRVFDILGKEVATLLNEKQAPGVYEVTFDGSGLSSGIYFYRIQAGDFSDTKKMLMIK
ncbi:MAG: YCF48-related protein [Ignavibacteriae bacterium]|nr:YCF48-related protein [Ignavibacteriota bacterium]